MTAQRAGWLRDGAAAPPFRGLALEVGCRACRDGGVRGCVDRPGRRSRDGRGEGQFRRWFLSGLGRRRGGSLGGWAHCWLAGEWTDFGCNSNRTCWSRQRARRWLERTRSAPFAGGLQCTWSLSSMADVWACHTPRAFSSLSRGVSGRSAGVGVFMTAVSMRLRVKSSPSSRATTPVVSMRTSTGTSSPGIR